jgi:hypothetical protein
MATHHFSVQPFRPVFLATAGTPPVEWRRWIDMFEDYSLAVGFPVPTADATDAVVTAIGQRKAAFLRSSLGFEDYRVYCSLMDNTREPYADAVEVFSVSRPASFFRAFCSVVASSTRVSR